MEDLLTPEQQKGLVYLPGKVPKQPVEWVARKAEWILSHRREGFRALKLKIGRMKWMDSFEAAIERDVAVTQAVRKAVGKGIQLMVDGNKAYAPRPLAVAEYAAAVRGEQIYFMEEMFPEVDSDHILEVKHRLRSAGNPIKLAAGESYPGGIPELVYTRRFAGGEREEPLIDVEQADMNAHGFLGLRAKAAIQNRLGMTMAPHNFGSKLGLYAAVHLGLATPNWDFCEMDDSEFPAIKAEGIEIRRGEARLMDAKGLGVSLVEDELEKPMIDLKA